MNETSFETERNTGLTNEASEALRSLIQSRSELRHLNRQLKQLARCYDELLDCWAEGDAGDNEIGPGWASYGAERDAILAALHRVLDAATSHVAALR